MECKLPIKDFDIREDKRGVKRAVIRKKQDLPSKLQIGEAWKVFGKWMVAIGESDQNEVDIPIIGKQSGHICIVLRGLGFTLYFYELINDYTKEQYQAFDQIRLMLDRVLVTNQGASARLRYFLENREKWKGNIFPRFFNEFPQEKIAEWAEQIDEEIDDHSKKVWVFEKGKNREKYWNEICNPTPEDLKWDVKGCYAMLLSAFNTIKPTLPEENIEIIDEIIIRCEHGYFLGFLLEKTLEDYANNHKKHAKAKGAIRSTSYLRKRLTKFRKNREKKVRLAAKEAFGLTPKVNRKLKRMFVLENVE